MELRIEEISEKYLKDAHKIYNYYIINSYSNFEEKKLTFNQFHNNYKNITKNKLPYLIALIEKKGILKYFQPPKIICTRETGNDFQLLSFIQFKSFIIGFITKKFFNISISLRILILQTEFVNQVVEKVFVGIFSNLI